MQRHKEPLDFVESPHEGVRHYTSPVLAAQRPFLASSISAELLSAHWVSPQFSNEDGNSIRLELGKKRRRAGCRKPRMQKKKPFVQVQENVFPSLEFSDPAKEMLAHQDIDNDLQTEDVPPSRMKKASQLSSKRKAVDKQPNENINADKNQFLFSLGSPKPTNISGKILVPETPENQMFEGRILRNRNCKY